MAIPRAIIVDDTDPRITYVGNNWYQTTDDTSTQSSGPNFNRTLHSCTRGSLSFPFNGTSVQVIGHVNDTESVFLPVWNCTVDGVLADYDPAVAERYNYPFCQKDHLPIGEHQLTVTFDNFGAAPMLLDLIAITPHPGPIDAPAVVNVDNTDPDIRWGSGWQPNTDTTTYNLTYVYESTVQFTFVGSSITWVSSNCQAGNAATATFSIDGGEGVVFELPAVAKTDPFCTQNQNSFVTPRLPLGSHSLLVRYLGNPASGTKNVPLTLDRFLIDNTTLPVTTSSSSSVNVPASTIHPDPSGSSSGEHRKPIAPIVGGVVGGIALLGAIVLLVLCKRRPKKMKRIVIDPDRPPAAADSLSAYNDQLASNPSFPVPASIISTQPAYLQHPSFSQSDSQTSNAPSSQLYLRNPSNSAEQPSAPDTPARPMKPSGKARPGRESIAAGPTISQHQDSGIRLEPPPDSVIEVPPVYTDH